MKESVLKRRRIERLAEKSFDEILKPFRDDIEASGLSDNDLDILFQQARNEASKVRRNK